jgi:hypothetical protein
MTKEWNRIPEQIRNLKTNAWRRLLMGWIELQKGHIEKARRSLRIVTRFAPRGSPMAVLAGRCMHDPGSITAKDFRAIWWSR